MYSSTTTTSNFVDGTIEHKQSFGFLPRTTDPTDSGQFLAVPRPDPEQTLALRVGPIGWHRYKEKAINAAKQGNFSQSEAMWLAALIECKDFDEADERLAYTLDQLASLYFAQGRYEQAEMFCRRAFDVAVNACGGDNSKVASCLNNLAGIYYSQGRFAEAEPISVEVLVIYQRLKGHNHADVGMAANNLAMLYHAQGKFKFAEKYYLQAIKIRTKVLGTDSPIVQTLFANYINLLIVMDRVHEANTFKSWTTASSFVADSKAS